MAKVYTMEELERARKKAQIREWFQDKKVKAQTWCYEHKEQIITKVRPTVYGTATTGTSLEIKYKIQCRNCGFGCDKAGSVIVQYDEETMNPIADDHGLRKLIRDWDSILRDPDRERLADI